MRSIASSVLLWVFVALCRCRLSQDDDTSDAAVFGVSRGMHLWIDENVTYLLLQYLKLRATELLTDSYATSL